MKERNEYIGSDAHGEYKYYDIIDYDICCNCKHFSDNWRYERFECFSKECKECKRINRMKIKLKSRGYWDEYFCKITDRLDQLAGLKITNDGYCWRHYILYDDYHKKNNIMAIRIPGGTVGGIKLDENNVVKEIKINTDYVVRTYPNNVEEIMNNEFVGLKLEA